MNCRHLFAAVLMPLYACAGPSSAGQDDATAMHRQLSEMNAAEKQELEGKRKQFYSLPAGEQERLRKVHRDLCQAQDGDKLRIVMERYATWLRSLPSGQRAELLSLPPESRLARVKQLLEEQERWRMSNYVMRELTADDLAVIVRWMEDYVAAREAEILERVPHLKQRWESIEPSRRRQALVFAATMAARELLRPTEDDIGRLKGKLSESAKEELTKAEREGRLEELAERWMRAAMFSRRSGPPVDREELQRFYKEMDARQREFLENLPAERMEQELTRLYHYSRFRKFIESDRPPFSRPGDGFRGRGWGNRPGGEGSPPPLPGEHPKGPPFGSPFRDRKPPEFGPPKTGDSTESPGAGGHNHPPLAPAT